MYLGCFQGCSMDHKHQEQNKAITATKVKIKINNYGPMIYHNRLHNLESALQFSTMENLVLNSMLVYVEIPTFLPPTMMALAAMGTHPTSCHLPETLQKTQANMKAPEGWIGFNFNTFSSIVHSPSIFPHIHSYVHSQLHADNASTNHLDI